MTRLRPGVAILGGVALIFGVTLAGAAADGATKHLAGRIAAPQLYFFAGLGVALISLAFERALPAAGAGGRLTTRFGRLLALRSLLVVASTLFYYHAFARLPLAEVFVFIGLTPLLAAGAAYPVLGERVAPTGWLAIMLGGVGVLFLFPGGIGAVSSGHWLAAGGVITGTLSLVLMRRMTRSEDNALAQVFWPHVAMAVVMGLALPTAWQPMSLIDGLLVGGYVLAVFLSRRLLVPAVTRLRVHVAMMLLNLQFLWMVGLDRLAFDQGLAAGTLAGAGCIILAGCALVAEQARQDRPDRPRIATSPALAQPRLHPAE